MMIKIEQEDNSLTKGLQQFFKKLLETQEIDALFLPVRLKDSFSIMPSLVTDPAQIENAVPLSPAFPLNSGRMVSRLSYKESGRKTAVLLRPCEIRAFIELIKLKQGSRQELILIGIDCPKALTLSDYTAYMEKDPLDDDAYIQKVFSANEETLNGFSFSSACNTCENPFPVNTDMNILLHGVDLSNGMMVESGSEAGRNILETLNMQQASEPEKRDEVVTQIKEANSKANEAMIKDIEEKTNSITKLNAFFDRCINCYNCRNMCPVCYCKECVFNTDVFYHQPVQYHQWAEKKGSIKLPTDTVFYHLTRLAHISHACVGCGQCSNACPSDINVFEVFKSVAQTTQAAFEYLPGIDENDPPPLSVFTEKEFEDIVGIK
ncbi:MAG: 4Fe-4S dicluster domain-containing protein [Desulfobacula sp.]|uniref:4Fe-4S dicluster domain-containing protein n=1 Tax=Desulfobacula sp. TaxID=2593537 RepID=UPI0025C4B79C|nr:4Fe-4S dicluster domain-containing protein [Desulfobacula sp.]MCD4719296.1 4Fe-4S dicluster domain-containing protein [Desulfobacula sp.]